jgi:hypothetical protein
MPLPKTSDVGKIMDVIKEHHKSWPLAKKRAVALDQARRHGANIPQNPYQEAVNRSK